MRGAESREYRISVIINTHNEEKFISDCIESVLHQTRRPDEVLIVDNASMDRTVEIASRYPVRVIKIEPSTRGRARDIGWRKALGDLILYGDADDVFSDNWVEEIEKKFHEGADAVIDRIKVYEPRSLFERSLGAHYDFRFLNYKPFVAWAFRRDVLEKIGGFRDKWIEDYDLGLRLLKQGYKIVLAEKAIRYHRGEPRSFSNYIKRNFVFGKLMVRDIFSSYPEEFPRLRIALFFLFSAAGLLSIFFKVFIYFVIASISIFFSAIFLHKVLIQKIWRYAGVDELIGMSINTMISVIFYTLGIVYGFLIQLVKK